MRASGWVSEWVRARVAYYVILRHITLPSSHHVPTRFEDVVSFLDTCVVIQTHIIRGICSLANTYSTFNCSVCGQKRRSTQNSTHINICGWCCIRWAPIDPDALTLCHCSSMNNILPPNVCFNNIKYAALALEMHQTILLTKHFAPLIKNKIKWFCGSAVFILMP